MGMNKNLSHTYIHTYIHTCVHSVVTTENRRINLKLLDSVDSDTWPSYIGIFKYKNN